ncbi:putative glucooligosaccharide oxidase [Neofusicoccum parvum]|nr:putative glucooligosaccharide oxidase [Neofusicoccum parvum]
MPASHSFPQSTDNNAALQACLTKAVEGDAARAQFPSEENFRTQDVKPYNRQYPYTPTAVILSIGGFSPVTRRAGLTLDALREVEVVPANGIVARAPASQHPDLFWATRGAGQSFGVATEFVFQTKPEPSNPIISYQCNITSPSSAVLAGSWQAIIAGPQLPRDLYTLAFLQGATLLVRGTFSDALALASRIPGIASGGVTGEASWPATSADLFRFFDVCS